MQVIVIHGGDAFDTYEQYLDFLRGWQIAAEDIHTKRSDWKEGLGLALGPGYEVIAPKMPNKLNAKYLEWTIWFEKYIPHLDPEVILVGHSMGGIFLVKYLAEHEFPKTIHGLFLVAAPYDSEGSEPLGDFVLPADISRCARQTQKIFLYHSTDDPVVPVANAQRYQAQFPGAIYRTLHDRGHINQEQFPELVADIRSLFPLS